MVPCSSILADRFRCCERVCTGVSVAYDASPVVNSLLCTCRACCALQLQEKILEWFKKGSWQEIVAEKRSVLTSMQQVLQSCYALLDSTQVPVNSIIKLLQHILRLVKGAQAGCGA